MTLATWWRMKTPGSAYWRCTVPAKHLPGRVNRLLFSDLQEVNGEPTLVHQEGGTAIWQFSGNATRGLLMANQQAQGVRVLLEVDDNYLVPAPFMQDWQIDFAVGGDTVDGDKASLAAHKRICEWVDGIIVSTENLAAAYRTVNPNVWVCPNSVDPDDWPEPAKRTEKLRVGWAASHSHHVDAPLVRRAMEWLVRQPDTEVYLLGYQPDWRGPFKRIEWTDTLEDYRGALAALALDIGICPLKPTVWANGKSDVKALEYAICGALPVCSRVEPYAAWKGPALWCHTPRDWENSLHWALHHRQQVRRLADQAREYVLANRTIKQNIQAWREAVAA